jgi:hypothetical protein
MRPEDIKGLGNVVGDAVGNLGSKEFLAIPPQQKFAMLQGTVLNFDPQAGRDLGQNLQQYGGKLDGMLAALGADQYKQIDPGAMVGMMQAMNLGGEGFVLGQTALRGQDVASMFGALDPANLKEFGGEKVLGSIKDLQKGDFGDLDAKAALNIFKAVGSDKALGLANLGGIAGKFDAAAFKELGNTSTFGVVKALEVADLKALDKSAALGAATTLGTEDLKGLDGSKLAGLITSVKEGALELAKEHVEAFLTGIGAADIATLDKGAVGNLVGAASDADFLALASEVKAAHLENLGANLLGAGAGGFGAAGAADTVFNIVPGGAYAFTGLTLPDGGAGVAAEVLAKLNEGGSLAEVIGATGGPALFGGNLFGGGSP